MGKISDDISLDSPSVSRRATVDHSSSSSRAGRILHLFSTREKVMEGFKTFAWVVPLTLLIWVYAEREQLVQAKQPNAFNVPVKILSHDSTRRVESASGSSMTVNLKLSGTQEAVRSVVDTLNVHSHDVLTIYVSSSLGNGKRQPVNVVDHIQSLELFKTNGVTVEESIPAELLVNIDTLDVRPMAIELPDQSDLAPSSHFTPAKVSISGPKTLLDQLSSRGLLHVYPDPAGYAQFLKQPGDHPVASLPLTFPSQVDKEDRDRLVIDPPQVGATISVAASDEKFALDSVLISVHAPPGIINNGKYDLEVNKNINSIPNVNVSGPHDQIERLRTKQFAPEAWIALSADDVSKDRDEFRPLHFTLPPGVTSTDADSTVELKVTRRD